MTLDSKTGESHFPDSDTIVIVKNSDYNQPYWFPAGTALFTWRTTYSMSQPNFHLLDISHTNVY